MNGMKLITSGFLSLILILSSACLYAENKIMINASEIIGTWKLNATSLRISGGRRKAAQTWEFRSDGMLVTNTVDERVKGGEFTIQTPYVVENNQIIADEVGRPGRKVTYEVYEKTDTEMILKANSEGFFFFTKQ